MKRIITLLPVAMIFSIIACSKKESTGIADVLLISQDAVAFGKAGGSATIAVACPSDWTVASSDGSWLTASALSSSSIEIKAGANDTGQDRTARVTVASARSEETVTVIQASASTAVSIEINAPESRELDSEEDSFSFSVDATCPWTATSSADWLMVEYNPAGGLVTVSAGPNPGDRRSGTVTIASVDQAISRSLAVEQMSRSENPYFNYTGYYGLHAEDWYYGGNPLSAPGIGTYCTIEADEYGKSFIIKDLFKTGTEISALYDKRERSITIELGRLCYTYDYSPTSTHYLYLVRTKFTSSSFTAENITGILGEGQDEEGRTRKAILIRGLDPDTESLGLVALDSSTMGYFFYADLYYAAGEMYLVECDKN